MEDFEPPQYQSFFNNIPQGFVPVYGANAPSFSTGYNPNYNYPVQEDESM